MKTLHTKGKWLWFQDGKEKFTEIGIITDTQRKDGTTYVISHNCYHNESEERQDRYRADIKLMAMAPELLDMVGRIASGEKVTSTEAIALFNKATE